MVPLLSAVAVTGMLGAAIALGKQTHKKKKMVFQKPRKKPSQRIETVPKKRSPRPKSKKTSPAKKASSAVHFKSITEYLPKNPGLAEKQLIANFNAINKKRLEASYDGFTLKNAMNWTWDRLKDATELYVQYMATSDLRRKRFFEYQFRNQYNMTPGTFQKITRAASGLLSGVAAAAPMTYPGMAAGLGSMLIGAGGEYMSQGPYLNDPSMFVGGMNTLYDMYGAPRFGDRRIRQQRRRPTVGARPVYGPELPPGY
jgi:hypothetical protein